MSIIARATAPARVRNRVEVTEEFLRVMELPRKQTISPQEIEAISAFLRVRPDDPTCIMCAGSGLDKDGHNCKGCGGTGQIRLRPEQAEALREAYDTRTGAFLNMQVGKGKTLITLLVSTLLDVPHDKGVLLIPASLRAKTLRDYAIATKNWRVTLPQILHYEALSRPDKEAELFRLNPRLLVEDEAHMSRNLDAAVTRRIKRYQEARAPMHVCMSGTLITEKIAEFQHHLVWALKDAAPVPRGLEEAKQWDKALNGDHERSRFDPGPLAGFDFGEHLRGSRGVVASTSSDVGASIEISRWTPRTKPETLSLVQYTKDTKMRPDGEMLDDLEVTDVLMQLALGFYYVWDPLPPEWWLLPRRAWFSYLRAVLEEHLIGFDSPTHVISALDHGPRTVRDPETWQERQVMPPGYEEGRALLRAWRSVRDAKMPDTGRKFEPNTVPIWVDGDPLTSAAECPKGTVLWTRFSAAGHAFRKMGIPYFDGEQDPETAKPGITMACSIKAHGTGKNLQAWHRGRILTPMAKNTLWEQLIGRFHRPGQREDTVFFEIIESIDYHTEVMDRVYASAEKVSRQAGFSQKLVDATWT